jgi:histidinol-phosphate aminotransferase
MMSLPKIAQHIEQLPPYTPIEPFEVLSERLGRVPEAITKLDANENPYGPSPRVRQALAGLRFPHIYPDPESRLLRGALEAFTGVPQENLLAGAGADELIDLLLRVFIEPGDCVLTCPPTFGMYAFDTYLNAGQVVEIPRRKDFSLDLEALRRTVAGRSPKLLFLASPNNPDGSLLGEEKLEALLDLPVLVVLDEAYIEFTGQGVLGSTATRIRSVPGRENLVVLRTFSKWAGLAGLRVGYGAFPAWLMPVLWKAKQPYNISVAASAAACASLEDIPALAETVEKITRERERLQMLLGQVGYLQPYPSRANFILCWVAGREAASLKRSLALDHGIFVRYFDTPRLKNHLRISAGRPEDTERLIAALLEV